MMMMRLHLNPCRVVALLLLPPAQVGWLSIAMREPAAAGVE